MSGQRRGEYTGTRDFLHTASPFHTGMSSLGGDRHLKDSDLLGVYLTFGIVQST